jgi:hypothetical protein
MAGEHDPEATKAPEFPLWKAFVVQFGRGEGPGSFCGRVEHLSSGRRTRFGSREELLEVLEREIADIERSSE